MRVRVVRHTVMMYHDTVPSTASGGPVPDGHPVASRQQSSRICRWLPALCSTVVARRR